MKNITLITGGARSGKSMLAERLALAMHLPVYYIATMPTIAGDEEQELRIKMHKQRRPKDWTTCEVEIELPEHLRTLPKGPACIVIDCLSLFVSNLLINADDQKAGLDYLESTVLNKVDHLIEEMAAREDLSFLVVTNEVGWGVVPETPLGRNFRDALGFANQKVAAAASSVYLTCSGIPIMLKPQQ